MAYIERDKIPYYLDTSEEAPIEGRMIAFKSEIDKLPAADVVEVVRCKNCKHSRHMIFSGFHYCKRVRAVRKEDDFCSKGTLKERGDG